MTLSESTVLVPATGEILDLAAPEDQLALAIDQIRDLERQLAAVRAAVGDELIARMDRQASWTLHAGLFTVTAPSPAPTVEYDVPQLRTVLEALVTEGVITDVAADNALVPKIEYRPSVRGLNALRKLGPAVAARIDACATEITKHRRVTVKRKES